MTDQLHAFANHVGVYCKWVESPPSDQLEEVRKALRLVAALYQFALALRSNIVKDYPIEIVPTSAEDRKNVFARFASLPFNYYWDFLRPFELNEKEATMGDLADDLTDIYFDLKTGASLYQAKQFNAAETYWRHHFDIHWGKHAASAINALHSYANTHSIVI